LLIGLITEDVADSLIQCNFFITVEIE